MFLKPETFGQTPCQALVESCPLLLKEAGNVMPLTAQRDQARKPASA